MRAREIAESNPWSGASVSAEHATAGAARLGSYLTDEVFLYRVVSHVESEATVLVELEDCYLLDVVRVPVSVVHERCLRVVVPEAVAVIDQAG